MKNRRTSTNTKSSQSSQSEQLAQLEKLLTALDIFAAGLTMVVSEFNDRMQELRTGARIVRGNEGVVLGTMKTGRK